MTLPLADIPAKALRPGLSPSPSPRTALLDGVPQLCTFDCMSERPNLLYRLLANASRPLALHAFGLEAAGVEQLPPSGGFVLCANHLSVYDPWALALPLYPRQLRFMAKAELFRPPFRSLLGAVGLFPAGRGADGAQSVATAARHTAAGRPVLVFPAGARRCRIRAEERPKTGAARAALAAAVPLIPAAVAGTDGAGHWRVVYGPAILVADLSELSPREAARRATRRLWETITALEGALEVERALPLAMEGSRP